MEAAGDCTCTKNYVICPTCKGKGYKEESEINESPIQQPGPSRDCKPKIYSQKQAPSQLLTSRIKDKIENKIPILPSRMNPAVSMNMNSLQNLLVMRPRSRGNFSETSEMAADLIGYQEIENPQEYSKIVKAQLTSKDWSDRLLGMQGAVHLNRVEPELAVDIGRIIFRTILDELNSLRSKCVRVACQAARELYQNGGGFIYRPVFDEVVSVLMNRTADSKRVLREDADDALMAVASYCPIQHVTRAFAKGAKHKHQLVRKCTIRMLKTLIHRIGVTSLMQTNNYRDVRTQLLEVGCTLMDDSISEIRNAAKELMTPIVQTPEFDVLIQEIDKMCYRKVKHVISNLQLGNLGRR